MTPLNEDLRKAMRRWATGVTIVTAAHAGERHGMTVNSFTSISLDPPLIFVSLERSARTRQLALDSGLFAVNILTESQQELSNRFAGRIPDVEDRFAGLEMADSPGGAPLVPGALAWLDCRVSGVFEISSHTIVVGAVTGVWSQPPGPGSPRPLLYYERAYFTLEPLPEDPPA